ncbi:MAG UNVERIFIED_CONTAM: hypothetical protein LVR18_47665 [Planctomycetaceae bacterium]|jgi:alanine dehydrogenase
MQIGLPKEIKADEYRVAMLPSGVEELTRDGHRVFVERGAGLGSGIPDEAYTSCGAILLESHAEVFASADLIVKVKEPLPAEWPMLRPGQIIFTYFHLAANEHLTRRLLESGITAVAYETLRGSGRDLPLLTPMSEVAGRMSIQQRRSFWNVHRKVAAFFWKVFRVSNRPTSQFSVVAWSARMPQESPPAFRPTS